MEHVILVDENDNEVGTMEKMEAHRKGVLHRAFSILLFDETGRMLIQKRANDKYHSGNLWTNACCSHPLPGESLDQAARRRLREELGIEGNPEHRYSFIYRAELDDNVIEHELDHVFVGTFDGTPEINEEEISDWKYVKMDWLKEDINRNPDAYTEWFKIIIRHPELESIT
jgi:isopentenyl-diphosphate delta-isomerase